MNCPNCCHPEEDHGPICGQWATGEVIPGRLCYYAENQGYSEDLCACPGFDATEVVSYFETLLSKSGANI